MQFCDLNKQYKRIESEVTSRTKAVLQHQKFIMGPEVQELEKRLADFVGVKHVIPCASGTDALTIPLMAYNLEKTDAVFVPSFTFFASAESISLAGGTPVFIDSDASSFNISVVSLRKAIESTIEENALTPRGIMAVDLFGQPADYTEIHDIANQYGLFIIEDAAQSFGAVYRDKRAGSLGNVGATSFFPSKPLGCYGDGGAIFTDDDQLAEIMRSISIHGKGKDKYDNIRIGLNSRLDTLQAAILLAKLDVFEDEIKLRNKVAEHYSQILSSLFELPVVCPDRTSVWAQYTIKTSGQAARNKIVEQLKQQGIPTAVYYPTPIHLSTAYKNLEYKRGYLPVCEKLSEQVLSLPMHPYLNEENIQRIASTIKSINLLDIIAKQGSVL